jgi:hypothetical protein
VLELRVAVGVLGAFEALANEIVDLAEAPGRRVALVSSGAIALGVEALGFAARPRRMDQLQACAAAGQGLLIRLWSEVFALRRRVAAQVLLTHSDFAKAASRRLMSTLARAGTTRNRRSASWSGSMPIQLSRRCAIGSPIPEDRADAARTGFNAFVSKPIDLSELLSAVSGLAGRG